MADRKEKDSHLGIWGLIVKLGGKFFFGLLTVLGKLAKVAKVGKVALAAISLAAYTYMFTWEFAVMLMVMLFVHESGHVWAMKRYGVKTKGFYYIPFIGGAAVAESEFPSRKAEVVIALMGPIWGLTLAVATAGIYLFTRNPLFAAASAWMAMINLFNLLPINPLDGGRVFSSIAFSIHSKIGAAFLTLCVIASGVLALRLHMGLFVFLLIIGSLELVSAVTNLPWYYEFDLKLKQAMYERAFDKHNASIEAFRNHFGCDEPIGGVQYGEDGERFFKAERRLKKTMASLKVSSLKLEIAKSSPIKPTLNGLGIIASAVGYFAISAVLFWVMFYMNHIPGAQLAMKVLEG
jgi:Zn-dependent protease